MSTISEVFLPGVGRKFQVETMTGDRLVIVIHDDGTRELYHFTRSNMDRPASVLRLSDGEARQIAGIVGGLTYVPRSLLMAEVILGDLVLEWFTIERGAPCIGRTIRELEVRTRTGASVVSIIEPDQTTRTNPEADTVLNEGEDAETPQKRDGSSAYSISALSKPILSVAHLGHCAERRNLL